MKSEQADIVVLGGGPAGSTFASIVKKYSPETKVVVLEKARFPRWHVGESTIPVANGVFRELGVFNKLLESNFVKKMGVTFVWGQDRIPWSADYLKLGGLGDRLNQSDIIDVTGQDFTQLGKSGIQEIPFSAFNVRRAEFDHMLLNQARYFGAEVREETVVTKVVKNCPNQAHTICWRNKRSESGQIAANFVLDATGLAHVMTQGEREYDSGLNNFAVYGYLSDAEWKVTFNGTREQSAVFIASVEQGWIWYFPVDKETISVGAVTNTQHFKENLSEKDKETFFWEMLNACPEVSALVKNAYLRDDVLPNGDRVGLSRDWSSWAKQPVGPGWAAAGDAAVFVDPILSTGVTLALQSGHRAAYTYLTAQKRPDVPGESLWRAYADYLRGEYGSFLTLARYFYGNNKASSSWWWTAQKIVNAAGQLELTDRDSFTMASAGFFPIPRVFGQRAEVVAPMLEQLSGTQSSLVEIYQKSGVPDDENLLNYAFKVLTPFRLDVRTEPRLNSESAAQLEIYYDLVPKEIGFYHRIAAVPTRISPTLRPVVEAMQQACSVSELVEKAGVLLRSQVLAQVLDTETLRQAVLSLVRVAAMKGFIQLDSLTANKHDSDSTAQRDAADERLYSAMRAS